MSQYYRQGIYHKIPIRWATKLMSGFDIPHCSKSGIPVAKMYWHLLFGFFDSLKCDVSSRANLHRCGFDSRKAKSLKGTTREYTGLGRIESGSTFSFSGWCRRNTRHSASWIVALAWHSLQQKRNEKELDKIETEFRTASKLLYLV